MKSRNIIKGSIGMAIATAALFASPVHAQKIQPAQLPAPVAEAFNKSFSNAMDVEWKLMGTQYKVEFETGLFFTDHEAWYDAGGKLLRHEEEISGGDLPAEVTSAIKAEFAGYDIDDVERITTEGVTSYVVELKQTGQPEWKVAYDAAGRQLQKMMD